MPRQLLRRLLLAPVLLLAPAAASAQLGFLGGVFANITDVDAGFVRGSTTGKGSAIADSGSYGLRGLAIEATFGLGNLIAWGPKCVVEPVPKEIQIHYPRAQGGDSVVIIEPKAKPCPARHGITGELGFGYAQIGRFRGSGGVTASGAIEEVPFVTLYTALETSFFLTPYLGLRGGLVQLKDFKTTVAGAGAKGAASTFEYGGLVGLGVTIGAQAVLFAEMAWTHRTFDGIEWTPSDVAIPAALLRPLELNTRTITAGLQIQFKTGN